MPQLAGETIALSVYADVHYFFSPAPGQAPGHTPHHRFEKGSFLYIYRDGGSGSGRVELANNAGTPDQDVLATTLTNARISYSYEKCTCLTLRPPKPDLLEAQEWKLPAYDPANGPYRYTYHVDSVDIYFWAPEDALQCVQALQDLRGLAELELSDAPPSKESEQDGMSPLIQRLETAVRLGSGEDEDGQGEAAMPGAPGVQIASPPAQATQAAAAAFAPPPAFAPSPESAPLAYNPAAPAPPEARVHREKTPPPPEEGTYNGSMGAQYNGQSNPYGMKGYPSQQYAGQQQFQSFAPPPSQISPPNTGYTSPPLQSVSPVSLPGFAPPPSQPPSTQPQSSGSFSAYQAAQYPLPFSPPPQQTSFSQAPPYQNPQHQGSMTSNDGLQRHASVSSQMSQQSQLPSYNGVPAYQQPGGAQAYMAVPKQYLPPGPQSPPQGQPQFVVPPLQGTFRVSAQQQAQQAAQQKPVAPPPGGFANYSYAQPRAPAQQDPARAIHQQVYRPTELEVAPQGKVETKKGIKGKAHKVEGKVNRFLKMLDEGL